MKSLRFILVALTIVACSATSATPAVDYFGNNLPANLMLHKSPAGVPLSVSSGTTELMLYAYGSSPSVKLNNFQGLKRECSKILPSHTGCYSTNQFETNIKDESICGYEATPTVVVACTTGKCVSEIYVHACDSSYPKVGGTSVYSQVKSAKQFAGTVNDTTDFNQEFSSSLDFTMNLHVARMIKQQQRSPVVGVGSMLFNVDGSMKYNAGVILDKAIAEFPDVFTQGVMIEIQDEPFMNMSQAAANAQAQSINSAVAVIRSRIPSASIGVVVAPTWDYEQQVLPATESIMFNMNWVATDLYQQVFGDNRPVTMAKQFSDYMKVNHPNIPRFLIAQGFAPVFSKRPNEWGITEINLFSDFLSKMEVESREYNGVLIWGWNKVYELNDDYAGKNFPDAVKNIYKDFSK